MSYLTLTRQEIKELISVRLLYFIGYLMIAAILFLGYLEVLRHFLPRMLNAQPLFCALLFALVSFGALLYSNKAYLQEIIQKKKRVYKGVLGIKNSSRGEYSFCMDGYIFTVEEEEYNKFNEGDLLEFHISPSTKHLFKVIKIES